MHRSPCDTLGQSRNPHPALQGRWRDVFTGEAGELALPVSLKLPGWGYRVLASAE